MAFSFLRLKIIPLGFIKIKAHLDIDITVLYTKVLNHHCIYAVAGAYANYTPMSWAGGYENMGSWGIPGRSGPSEPLSYGRKTDGIFFCMTESYTTYYNAGFTYNGSLYVPLIFT